MQSALPYVHCVILLKLLFRGRDYFGCSTLATITWRDSLSFVCSDSASLIALLADRWIVFSHVLAA